MSRLAALALVAQSTLVFADDLPPAMPPPAMPPSATPPVAEVPRPERVLGVGYKLGNGIGIFGADVIINPVPHLSIDLYGTYVQISDGKGDNGTGYAAAPALQYHVFDHRRSTPYAAVGMQYVHLTLGSAAASGTGVFANLGYEWKWASGFAIQLGGGIQHISKVEASDGTRMVTTGGQTAPNLELGFRYMFL
jgi:hypothetical protein